MAWEVEVSDEFGELWDALDAAEQKSVDFTVTLLSEAGPTLRMPHSSGIETSRHKHMRELRIQHEGRPYRVLYAFDPRRTAILLIGGDKTGNNRWLRGICSSGRLHLRPAFERTGKRVSKDSSCSTGDTHRGERQLWQETTKNCKQR
jgi:hypothetical protein